MVRVPLSASERRRGSRLGLLLREARGERSMVEVAAAAGLSVETLRKIEHGRIPTPAFFTVAAIAGAVGVSLDALALLATIEDDESATAGAGDGPDRVSTADDAPAPTLVRQSHPVARRLSA